MTRAWLVTVLLLAGADRWAHAGPEGRAVAAPSSESRPVAAPPPDGTGEPVRSEPADTRRIVGILEVRVDGIPDEIKESFQRGLEHGFDARRYRLDNRAQMKQALMRSTRWTEGCLIGQCLTEVRKQTGADLVLLAALTGSGTSFGYVVTLVRTDTGRVLRQDSQRCEVCTVNEAMDKATRATMALLDKLPDRLPDEAAEQDATLERAVGKVKQEAADRDRHMTRLGIALTLGGIAAAIAGGVMYARDQPNYAAMIMAGGSAAAVSGIVVLTF